MKIAYFLDTPVGLGGAGNLLLRQAALMSQIYDVIVVIPCDENGYENKEYVRRCMEKELSYITLYYETSYNFYNINYLGALEWKKNIREFAVREKITFFHSVQLNIVVEMVARELRIPHLMDVYQMQEEEFALAYIDIYPHYHLCDSDLYTKRWSTMLHIKSRCVRPVAPDNRIMRKSYFPKESFRIIMLGGICERKNQLAAIQAIEKCLERYSIVLEIAGNTEGFYGDKCKEYVRQHNLSDNVHFLDFVSNIGDLLLKYDCLLCTSMDESFPTSIVEAVTFDLTIISTPVAGVPEVFYDKYNAYISTGFQKENICNAIMDCLDAYIDGSISKVHMNAWKTWNKHFAPNVVRQAINQYYIDIINDRYVGNRSVYKLISEKELNKLYAITKSLSDDADKIYKRAYYYYYLKKNLTKGEAYIWGAGKLGQLAYKLIHLLELEIEIIAFIDEIKTGRYCEISIIKPDEIDYGKADYFFISFDKGRDKVINYLKDRGIVYNRQLFLLP